MTKENIAPTHLTGINGFDSCSICDKEITYEYPGKLVMFKRHGSDIRDHVCNVCFNDPDYQEILSNFKSSIIKYKL